MTEPVQQPNDSNAELEELRRAKAELTQKSRDRKAKIVELEAAIAKLDTANAALQAQLTELTINAPMRSMFEAISTVPDVAMEQFNKTHKVELIDGKLTIVHVEDGKPVDVPFERNELTKYLIDESNPQSEIFGKILIVSRASGAVDTTSKQAGQSDKPTFHFGLR